MGMSFPDETEDLFSAPSPQDRFSYDDPWVNALALPCVFFLAWILNKLFLAGLLLLLVYHELGHGICAWLAGRWAFPIPIAGLTFIGEDFSKPVFLIVAAALWWMTRWTLREKKYGPLLLLSVLIPIQLDLSLFAEKNVSDMWITYAGCAGELILSTLVIIGFYYRLPDRLRWDFWRYPLILSAACVFLFSAAEWRSVRVDPENQMLGESVSKSRDSDNDWVKLVRRDGWTARTLADSYLRLSWLCMAGIGLHYIWFLAAAVDKQRKGGVRL